MKIQFTKMHGLGNDFVIINSLLQSVPIEKIPFTTLSNRRLGVGFDQLLLIGPSHKADFSCRIFNSDGTEAEQCGNGMRCIARYIAEEKLSNRRELTIETKAGIIGISVSDFNQIKVNMGQPSFDSMSEIKIDDQLFKLNRVAIGNPHAILEVANIDELVISDIGFKISTHAHFPSGVNVGFVERINPTHIKVRTFERGAGETLACGSNSCAAVVVGIQQGWLDSTVKVELPLGCLWVEWLGDNKPVTLLGPADRVFDGVFSF